MPIDSKTPQQLIQEACVVVRRKARNEPPTWIVRVAILFSALIVLIGFTVSIAQSPHHHVELESREGAVLFLCIVAAFIVYHLISVIWTRYAVRQLQNPEHLTARVADYLLGFSRQRIHNYIELRNEVSRFGEMVLLRHGFDHEDLKLVQAFEQLLETYAKGDQVALDESEQIIRQVLAPKTESVS